MQFSVFLISLLYGAARGHMGVSLRMGGNTLNSRDTAVGDAYRYPNAGHCHGIAPAAPGTTYAIGDTVTVTNSGGAAHGGGQCSIFLASKTEEVWYKQLDFIDCTTGTGFDWTITSGLVPAACGTDAGCTAIWTWTPRSSGACEIYMNCFDIKITGSGYGTSAVTINKNPPCARVNGQGISTTYGTPCVDAPCASAAADAPTAANTPDVTDPPTTTPSVGSIPHRCGASWSDANANCGNECTVANEATQCTGDTPLCFADMIRPCSDISPPDTTGSSMCRAVGQYADLPGMDSWCAVNCPDTCPASHCTCGDDMSYTNPNTGVYVPNCQTHVTNGDQSWSDIATLFDLAAYVPRDNSYTPAQADQALAAYTTTAANELLAYNQMCCVIGGAACEYRFAGADIMQQPPANSIIFITGDCQLTNVCTVGDDSAASHSSFIMALATILGAWLFGGF